MGGGEAVSVVAGIGLRRECAADEIVALVRRASEAAGRPVDILAAPALKRGEGLETAAAMLGVALILVEPAALMAAQATCVTRSAAAERAVGVASVAEGCALAGGGVLLLPRIASARATCALAEVSP